MNGQNVDLFSLDPIDGAIAADKDFSYFLNSQFWNNPTQAWIASQLISGTENPICENRRDLR